jgi:hypothetical protein
MSAPNNPYININNNHYINTNLTNERIVLPEFKQLCDERDSTKKHLKDLGMNDFQILNFMLLPTKDIHINKVIQPVGIANPNDNYINYLDFDQKFDQNIHFMKSVNNFNHNSSNLSVNNNITNISNIQKNPFNFCKSFNPI